MDRGSFAVGCGVVHCLNRQSRNQVAIFFRNGNGDSILGIGIDPAICVTTDFRNQVIVSSGRRIGRSEASFTGSIGINRQICTIYQCIPGSIRLHSNERKARLGERGITGVIYHFLGYINTDGCSMIGICKGNFVGTIGNGSIVQIGNLCHQPTVLVGDSHRKGIQGAIVGQILQATLHFQHLISPSAGLGIGNTIQHVLDLEGLCAAFACSIGSHRRCHIDPCATVPLLHQEGEGAALQIGIILCHEIFRTGNIQFHRGCLGGILIGDHSGCIAAGRNQHSAICICSLTGMIPCAVSCRKYLLLCLRQGFRDANFDSLRQIHDLDGLSCLDRQVQIAFCIHGFRSGRLVTGGFYIPLLHDKAVTCQIRAHIDRQLEYLCHHAVRDGMIAGHFLGDIQIAVLIGCVGDDCGRILSRTGQHLAQGRHCDSGRLGCDIVIPIDHFANGAIGTSRDTADIHRFTGLQLHSEHISAESGDACRNIVTHCILDHRIGIGVSRNGNGQRIGIIGSTKSFRNRLSQCDASRYSGSQSAVIAQPDDHIIATVQFCGFIGVLGCITHICRGSCVGVLGHRHVVQTAGAQSANAQNHPNIRFWVRRTISSNRSSNLIGIHGITLIAGCIALDRIIIYINASLVIIECNRLFQILPQGVNHIGHFFSSIGSVADIDGRTIVGHIIIDCVLILHRQIIRIRHVGEVILTLFIKNAESIGIPVDLAAILSGHIGKNSNIVLIIVVPINRRGLEADVGIAQIHIAIAVAIGGVDRTKGVAVERDLTGCIIDIGVILCQRGYIDLTGGQQNPAFQTHRIEDAHRCITHFRNGSMGHAIVGLGLDLLQDNGQHFLIDFHTQRLDTILVFGNANANILCRIITFIGGRIDTNDGFHSVSTVMVVRHRQRTAKQSDGLDLFDLHVLSNGIHIDQRCIFYTGTANHRLCTGDGIENAGLQFLIDLGEGNAQLITGNIEVLVHIVDIGNHIACGHTKGLGDSMVERIAFAFQLDRFAFCPFLELFIGGANAAVRVFVVKAVGCTRIHQCGTQAGSAQIRTHTVDHRCLAIMLFHAAAAIGSIQQGAQCNTGSAGAGHRTTWHIIPLAGNSTIGFAVCHDHRHRYTAFHAGCRREHVEAGINTSLQIGAGDKAIIAAQQFAIVIISTDHAATLGIGIATNAKGYAIFIGSQRQDNFTIIIICHNTDTHIAHCQQILDQIVGSFDGVLQAGLALNGICHGDRCIKHHDHVHGTHVGIGGRRCHRRTQCREDNLERLIGFQLHLEGRTDSTAGIEQCSLSIGEYRLICPHTARIAITFHCRTHHRFPSVCCTCICHDIGRL